MEKSRVEAIVYTASASDGVKLHDETLPGPEWFDVQTHPTAAYRADSIRRTGEGRYTVDGSLTIKDSIVPVKGLLLELTEDGATLSGRVIIDRADADLGMESDPRGQWVSRNIEVDVKARFRRPG